MKSLISILLLTIGATTQAAIKCSDLLKQPQSRYGSYQRMTGRMDNNHNFIKNGGSQKGFEIYRDLTDYFFTMGSSSGYSDGEVGAVHDLPYFMNSLKPQSLWIDAGAGSALATSQYQRLARGFPLDIRPKEVGNLQVGKFPFNPNLRAISIAMDKPELFTEVQDSIDRGLFNYVEADFIKFSELPENQGIASVITDAFGVLYYVNSEVALEAEARVLKVGGRIYFGALNSFDMFSLRQYMKRVKGLKWVESMYVDGKPIYPDLQVVGAYGYFERTAEALKFPKVERKQFQEVAVDWLGITESEARRQDKYDVYGSSEASQGTYERVEILAPGKPAKFETLTEYWRSLYP